MSTSLNARELVALLTGLQKDLKETGQENLLSGAEKICKEFQSLGLPRHSEILDVGPGNGVLSTSVQTHGYSNLDMLNDDLTALRNLKALRLYRNHIYSGITGLNSTGLCDDTYDVIMTSAGVTSQCIPISSTNLTELFRILRPGGVLVFTMYTGLAKSGSEDGLFDRNLENLEKEGMCQIIKKETFTDSGEIPIGEFYMVRGLTGQLPKCLQKPISKDVHETEQETEQETIEYNSEPDKEDIIYDACVLNYEDQVKIGKYTGHLQCAEAFLKLGLDRTVQILDVAAGTGLVGAEVTRQGYVQIDALDCSLGMLNKARADKIYKTYIGAKVIDQHLSIPVNDQTYDVILMANGFAPGQIYPSSLPEMLRVLQPGGYMLWVMKDGLEKEDQEFAKMDSYIQSLVRQKAAELLMGPETLENYFQDQPGRIYMLRKPHQGE